MLAGFERPMKAHPSEGHDIAQYLPHERPVKHDVPELRAVSHFRARQHRLRLKRAGMARADPDPRGEMGGVGQA